MSDTRKALLRKLIRWYGIHGFDKGKYWLTERCAPFLIPSSDPYVKVQSPHGFPMLLDLRDSVQQHAFYMGYHEPWIVRTLIKYIKSDSIMLDLGANFGQFTLLAAHKIGVTGKVFAFEPSPPAFEMLQRNVELNHLHNVTCIRAAVSIESGTAPYFVSPITDTGFSSLSREAVVKFYPNPTVSVVEVTRLDDYLSMLDKNVSLIKMDIQGAELMAIRGGLRLIRRDNPVLIVELDDRVTSSFGYAPRVLIDLLHELEYEIYSIPHRPWQMPRRVEAEVAYPNDIVCMPR